MKSELAVIDTNVLISAVIGASGYSRKIFKELIITGKIPMCVSDAVFQEYTEVLQRDRFKKYPDFVFIGNELLQKIKQHCIWITPTIKIDVLSDKDDNKFLELAVTAEAGFVVTGNSNDFVMKTFQDVSICSPKEFYERFMFMI